LGITSTKMKGEFVQGISVAATSDDERLRGPGLLPRSYPRSCTGSGGHDYYNTLRTCFRLMILYGLVWMWLSRELLKKNNRLRSGPIEIVSLFPRIGEAPYMLHVL